MGPEGTFTQFRYLDQHSINRCWRRTARVRRTRPSRSPSFFAQTERRGRREKVGGEGWRSANLSLLLRGVVKRCSVLLSYWRICPYVRTLISTNVHRRDSGRNRKLRDGTGFIGFLCCRYYRKCPLWGWVGIVFFPLITCLMWWLVWLFTVWFCAPAGQTYFE